MVVGTLPGVGATSVGTTSVGTTSVGTTSVGTTSVGTRSVGTRSVGTRSVDAQEAQRAAGTLTEGGTTSVALTSIDMQVAQRAVGALLAVTLTDLPPVVALADTQAVMVLSQQLTAELLRRLSDVDRRQLYALAGAPTIGTWVDGQHLAGIDRSQLALARRPAGMRGPRPRPLRCLS